MISQGIWEHLTNWEPLAHEVGERIYKNKLPQVPTLPAIVLTKITGESTYSTEGIKSPLTGRWQVDIYAQDSSTETGDITNERISGILDDALGGYQGPVGTELIQGSFLQNDEDLWNDEQNDSKVGQWRRWMEFDIWYKKTVKAGDLRRALYKVMAEQQAQTGTPGTPVPLAENVNAVFVRIINNNNWLVMIGTDADFVNASSSPARGFPLLQYDSRLLPINENADEVFIDSQYLNSKVTVHIYWI